MPDLVLEYSENLNTDVIKSTYKEARMCLILHAYIPNSAGELHRLSELGQFGCIPVVENWGDRFGLHHYKNCGDVVFSDYANLLQTIREVLGTIRLSPANQLQHSMEKRLKWWHNDIQWGSIIPQVFDGFPTRK